MARTKTVSIAEYFQLDKDTRKYSNIKNFWGEVKLPFRTRRMLSKIRYHDVYAKVWQKEGSLFVVEFYDKGGTQLLQVTFKNAWDVKALSELEEDLLGVYNDKDW